MSLPETIFLALVVAMFVGYGVVLFTAWLFVEVIGVKGTTAQAAFKAPAAVEAERPLSRAA